MCVQICCRFVWRVSGASSEKEVESKFIIGSDGMSNSLI